jgi:tetratricopeptide (TPR) repeat protein
MPALLAAGVIVLAGIAAYANSFSGVMVYDDIASIVENPTIRHLSPVRTLLSPPPGGLTVSGRPMLNLSFAVNYAISGTDVWSYHALNLLIHLSAALALFGIVRRTLQHLRTDEETATLLAFAVALLWTVHPLQTEAVTYIVQRAESLMGLFYLLTLYCFIRYTEQSPSFDQAMEGVSANTAEGGDGRPAYPRHARIVSAIWFGLSCLACLLGMATKEVMATAPVVVFLYDRTFIAGTFAKAWRLRWRAYAALAATWLPLAYLVAGSGGDRGGSAGFRSDVTGWAELQIQLQALARYLWLSIWPHPLIFDYGLVWIQGEGKALLCALPAVLLLAATLWALFRPALRGIGFLGAWTLGILAPSSLVPVWTQLIAEHRMYLSLAAVIAFLVLGIHAIVGRTRAVLGACLVLALGYGAMTLRRNEAYQSLVALWNDTAAKRPDNLTAQINLGLALDLEQRLPEAIARFERAVELGPDLPGTHFNLGYELMKTGESEEAAAQFETAVRLDPGYAPAQTNLGNTLIQLGRYPEAADHLAVAVKIEPRDVEAQTNLGIALAATGRLPEAVGHYEEALRLDPDLADAHYDLANALFRMGRLREAIDHYEAALQLDPGDAGLQASLERAQQALGSPP